MAAKSKGSKTKRTPLQRRIRVFELLEDRAMLAGLNLLVDSFAYANLSTAQANWVAQGQTTAVSLDPADSPVVGSGGLSSAILSSQHRGGVIAVPLSSWSRVATGSLAEDICRLHRPELSQKVG
jgi:hypothetical protein